ncbi:FmdB family zinc ribbon protein [Dactylosporangium sp. CA-233914]|uniref:FmdB family zinc ribbon protein n=1 Tax=Dactylosporangium sp. CA-233914 TaxID=3239934 RepID=UPI003D8E6B64
MPRYEYRCRACGDTFEVQRPMREANVKTVCPAGHDDTVKLLSTIAVARSGSVSAQPNGAGLGVGGSSLNAPRAGGGGGAGGGCCGGACGC